MAKALAAERVPLPPPVNGLDFRQPVFSQSAGYSPFMLNFYAEDGRLKKREPFTSVRSVGSYAIIPYNGGSYEKIISLDFANNTTDGTSTSATPAGLRASSLQYLDWVIYQDLILVPGNGTVQNLNPSTLVWTAGLTFTFATPACRPSICVYRERVYVGSGTNIYYGGVGATGAGAMTAFTTTIPANLVRGTISNIAQFAFNAGSELNQYLVVCTTQGEVLIYTGLNPGDTSWRLVTQFDLSLQNSISQPNPLFDLVEIPNDLLINHKSSYQVYSLRQLIEKTVGGGLYYELEPIRSFFTSKIKHPALGNISQFGQKHITYWPKRNSLVLIATLEAATYSVGADPSTFPYLDDWNTYLSRVDHVNNLSSSDAFNVVFLIDLNSHIITMHSTPTTSKQVISLMKPANTYSAVYASYWTLVTGSITAPHGIVKLFDETSSTPFLDFGSTAYSAIAAFPPVSGKGYRLKSMKHLILYSNLSTSHTFTYLINKNFSTTPGAFNSYAVASTSVEAQANTLGGYGSAVSFIPILKESASAATAFEIYGMDAILEEGGEY